jgi:hypothetical protein
MPRMVLRIDPTVPMVWRTPDTVQFGVDAPLSVIDRVTEPIERMIAALLAGISRSGLEMIARSTRAAPGELERLLALIAPALEVPTASADSTVSVEGAGPTASLLRQLLCPAATTDPAAEPELVVLVGHHVIPPERAAHWLRRDVPHLPIVYGDSVVRIGPLVDPGVGPCVRCVELHRRDADPAWPAIATQLLGRVSPIESALLATEVAAAGSRLVRERLARGSASALSIAIGAADGGREESLWSAHPECGCIRFPDAEPLSGGRPESGTASAQGPGPSRLPASSAPAVAVLG